MANILNQLADRARFRVSEEKKKVPLQEIRRQAEALSSDTGFPFE